MLRYIKIVYILYKSWGFTTHGIKLTSEYVLGMFSKE